MIFRYKHFWTTTLLLLALPMAITAQTELLTKDCDLPCLNKHYQVYVHLVADSLMEVGDITEIEQALVWTNLMFEPICISFSICEVDTIKNYAFDDTKDNQEGQELVRISQHANRINIYMVSELGLDAAQPEVCGFAALGQANSSDGAFIFFKEGCGNETMAHEMGHLFGLKHTFENQDELVDGSNCAFAGDGICDTPADPYVEGTDPANYIRDCEFIFEGLDANGAPN